MSLPYKITQTAAAIWLGMQLTAGYIVAPILFHLLPKMLAGEIAGILFAITAICGLVIFGAAYAFFRRQLASLSWWVLVLWLLLACNHLLVTPVIEAHKYGLDNWLLSLVGGTFGIWWLIQYYLFNLYDTGSYVRMEMAQTKLNCFNKRPSENKSFRRLFLL